MSASVSIVSACDRKFLWGAFLLAASAARHIPNVPLHLLQTGFTAEDAAFLTQFPSVRLHELSAGNARNVCNRKAEALLHGGDAEYVAWLDADCMVIGDITELLMPENGECQIRLREAWENAWVWRNHYAPGEPRGGLPMSVKEQWQKDVGELTDPRLDTTCVSNCFVVHRRHLDFIRAWGAQIDRVIPPSDSGVVNNKSPAYFMTDESVLSSLLAYSRLAPPLSDIRLNREPARHVAHFGANPKPWKRWKTQTWYCHAHVMSLLDWVRSSDYRLPEVPWSLRSANRLPSLLLATASDAWGRTRALGGKLLRR